MHSNQAVSMHGYPLTLQPACGTEGLSQLLPSAPILVCLRTTTEHVSTNAPHVTKQNQAI